MIMTTTSVSRFMHLILLVCVLSLVSILSASAAEDDPQKLVVDTTNLMLSKLKQEKSALDKNPKLVYDMVSEIVLPKFDFIKMSRWVLAKNWRKATKDQKIRFIKAFRELMVRTYAVALLEYAEQKITFLPLRDDPAKGDVTVRTTVLQPDGQKVAINYSIHKHSKGWKVYDISVEGVSLVANYRTSFASDVKRIGIDGLIERLEKHNKQKGGKS